MKFRIKGTDEVLAFRATIDGDLVLCRDGDEARSYIDTYFENDPVPDLEVTTDNGLTWWTENKNQETT